MGLIIFNKVKVERSNKTRRNGFKVRTEISAGVAIGALKEFQALADSIATLRNGALLILGKRESGCSAGRY